MTVLYLREEEVAELLTVRDAIDRLDSAFRRLAAGEAAVRPRQRVRVPRGMLHVMPAGLPDGFALGLKLYTTFAGAGARFHVLLFDAQDGAMVAIIQANRLGQIRTGAASGLATRYMARETSQVMGLIGTGWQAETQLEAVCAVRPIERVIVYGRDAARRDQFCLRMAERVTATLVPVDQAQTAVENADIVTTVTSSDTPVFHGSWLRPGVHVNAAGVNQPTKREIDRTTVLRADRIVTDLREQAEIECGDLLPIVAAGDVKWADIQELSSVVSGQAPGRAGDGELTLFESQGIALEDVAVADLVYRRALERGVGTHLPMS